LIGQRPAGKAARRALAEIDENLIRRDLTPAQRAKLIAQRKGAYQKAHPETKHGATGRRGKKEPNIGSFAADTAAKSGRSLASVKPTRPAQGALVRT